MQLLALGRKNPRRSRGAVLDGDSGIQDVPRSGTPSASLHRACLAGDVGRPLAESAGGRSADHLRHQRRPSAHVAQRRFRDALRSVSAAGLARTLSGSEDLGPDPGHPGSGTVGSAPAPQAPSDRVRSGADGEVRRGPQGRRSRDPAARTKCSIPDAFTIGFARRFATYKRATLLFRDVNRLKKILTNPDMPVQIVIAGKAHPKDHPGKTLIREIVQLSRDPELVEAPRFPRRLRHRSRARHGARRRSLAQQSAPRRRSLRHQRHEGQHQRRAEPQHSGWLVRRSVRVLRRMGHRRPRAVLGRSGRISRERDLLLLGKRNVPMYHAGGEDGVPDEWVRRMKQCLAFYQSTVQLPADGRRVHAVDVRSSPSRLR